MTSVTTPVDRAAARGIMFYCALAVFAQESMWTFYDTQVPPLLREHVGSAAVVGLLMGMDNFLGIFVQPWMGNRSDNTRTRWGRRMPYIAVVMPASALLFLLIPLAWSFASLVVVMFLFGLVGNSFKPVVESLMPDFVEPERRSRGNAAVKIASGLTTVTTAVISVLLVDDHPALAFVIPSGIAFLVLAVLVWRVRDNRSRAYRAALVEDAADVAKADAAKGVRMREVVMGVFRDVDRSRLLLLVSVLLFGGAYAASRALMTPYAMESVGLSRGDAGGLTLPAGVAFLIAAYPAALLAERIGRLRVMAIGMAVFAAAMVLGTVVQTSVATMVALGLAGVGASGFIINAAVVLWNLAPSVRVIGTYTGLYTVTWQLGGLVGPTVVGGMVDVTGWRFMLLDAGLLAALAVVAVLRIQVLARRRTSDIGKVL
ncbi:MFS transporter [Umezawaea sp. Da 62-37]|uniref:MFS transporter n=1 Tax=Umezawaea sp. Da 62-37 TaxID=3075927 RepID=UPI0028F6F9ED|nr:MFS transporter [Umezawaea sp. Da 62-37]WNV86138.1 MFS transporter [Umezawaea sp. Da 62-37]